ncbi:MULTISPECIES: molybdopterin-dependent oxidoreductase [unclassified Polaromonas]|jgi:anaerobic selenocysteine-containing dehydrogenase|nr:MULTISPECIES: molybdopterin-dependent oxidoreductase [unclassified Polaromonas]OYY36583.1 MAG: molybdopterin-binding oxidoreductase [Polaromonas sp. 35-63-35]OYZ22820.1 MAG: molybdopterin-binding oxidoreductase [Polaromonas sp. 16-63-31]OYZ80968.1 MAG: molybdopterin-binding oxidoreductase [Polaromonas sp. 24-63-21]OZA52814.1 MAG: molybdopterin-binding oxidoreductase [Polaromonas sp. 17-63-33]OZA88333.1 MAG: molybdopterin-binding oxidoreductase [Polaromonas sp. 39-63-25]
MSDNIHHRICPLCEACCGLELKVSDGKVISIRGHDSDVFSAGYICPKGVALKDLHEDPDRLRTPLIKRDGQFVPASWDEAFTEIERRLPPILAQHGRQAGAISVGNPSAHKIGLLLYFSRLAKALGSRNVFSASTLDQMPKQLSSGLMFGHWLSIAVPDLPRCDFLLVLGANPLASNGSLWTVPDFKGKAKAMQARGGKLVVIDPRRTETAAMADAHHFIRPGADVFLLLGLVHTLFDEKLVRLGRIAPLIHGVDAVEAAVEAFSAEVVAPRCGIAAETIRSLARQLAATPRAAVYGRIGTCTQEYGTLASWLVDVLNVLTGHLDEPGGAMFPKAAAFAHNTAGQPGSGRGISTGRHTSRVSGAPEVFGELPMTCLAEEIETPGPDQVRALITVASNPVLSSPNGARLARALDSLDFMVSLDIYVNETSRHADVILPGPSPLEDMHYDVAFPQFSWRNHARYSAPVFAAPEEQPAEWETLLKLAAIVQGQGAQTPAREIDDRYFAEDAKKLFGEQAAAVIDATQGLHGPDRLLELALRTGPYGDQFGREPEGLTLAKVRAAPDGIDLGELQPRMPEVLRTPSGKIELAPPALLQDLQRAAQAITQPVPAMVIVGRRDVRSNNSWMHNLPVLAKGPMRCTALVHPADAKRLGLADGALARISNQGRSIDAQVQVSEEMMPGVVSLPHGWGHGLTGTRMALAAERPGVNLNALLDEDWRDPLSGNAVLSGVPVVLEPVGA